MEYSLVLLAAGKGTRTHLEYNKVFYKFDDGEILIKKTASPFLKDKDCREMIIVTTAQEIEYIQTLFDDERIKYVYGGETRQESVNNGIQEVTSEYVMIHDGARCFIDFDSILRCKEALEMEDACLVMVPAVDTIKTVKDGYVVNTPQRSELYAAQTPQCFRTTLIKECMREAILNNYTGSDDASLVEKFTNVKVKVVAGNYANKKVTTKEDLK